jgi:transcription initiation factor TFIIIB Brf1 subunit/transcription initiation factor TFIIB
LKCSDCNAGMKIDTAKEEAYCQKCGLVEENVEIEKSTASQVLNSAGTKKDGKIVKSSWMMTSEERSLAKGKKYLQIYESLFALKKATVQDSLQLYKKLIENKLLKGKNAEELVCACIILSSNKLRLNAKDFKNYNKLNTENIRAACKYVQKHLNLKPEQDRIDKYMEETLFKLNFTSQPRSYAYKFLKHLKSKKFHTGKHPRLLVGAILYLTAKRKDLNLSQSKICTSLNIHPVYLRKHCRRIEDDSK